MREEAQGEVTADSRAAAAARLHFPYKQIPTTLDSEPLPLSVVVRVYAGDETDPHWEQATFSERATRERTGVASHTNTEAGRQAGRRRQQQPILFWWFCACCCCG